MHYDIEERPRHCPGLCCHHSEEFITHGVNLQISRVRRWIWKWKRRTRTTWFWRGKVQKPTADHRSLVSSSSGRMWRRRAGWALDNVTPTRSPSKWPSWSREMSITSRWLLRMTLDSLTGRDWTNPSRLNSASVIFSCSLFLTCIILIIFLAPNTC